jgi:hypothetical protein
MTTLPQANHDLEILKSTVSSPDAALVDLFLKRFTAWTENDLPVDEFIRDLERTLGGVWFSNNELHATVALILARLKDVVEAIGGMTMNERLATFGLFPRWDRSSEPERRCLYRKVLADP